MNEQLTPKITHEYSVEKFDNETLLYSEKGKQAVYLNDTAYAVWMLCNEDMTVREILDYLIEAYPDQKEQVTSDVTTALGALHEKGVIKFVDE